MRDSKNNTSKFSLNYLGRYQDNTSSSKKISKDRFTHLFSDWKKSIGSAVKPTGSKTVPSSLKNDSQKKRKIIYIGVSVVAVVILLFLFISLVGRSGGNSGGGADTKVSDANDAASINREFNFPLRNEGGEEVATFKYIIENVELRDEIIVKGQKATAIKGRDFLILTLKLQNSLDDSIEVNTKDYIRLSVNGNDGEWLAPDIHNDPVEVQAIAVKNTRLGFPISEDDNTLVIQVGEINGEKEKINIEF